MLLVVTDMKKEALNSTISTTHQSGKKPPLFCKFFSMLSPKNEKNAKVSSPSHHAVPSTIFTVSKSGELERVFRYFDENGDGKISPAELQNCLRAAGEELSAEDAEAVVESTDSDGDGLLGLEDFLKLVDAEEEEEKGRNIRDAFKMYEMEGQGCITPNSLRRMLRRLGETRSIDECRAMIRRFDLNGDGVISFDEFKVMML
ncbi:calcium-binding protein CML38 [Elaeis guineensis]|uniref:calcium-binding protein CML38 n=1 Tax=Elaeis guineensis var. tenera TaxID=51953 RepID=UPI003C6D7CDE